jgi:hypothetical protein
MIEFTSRNVTLDGNRLILSATKSNNASSLESYPRYRYRGLISPFDHCNIQIMKLGSEKCNPNPSREQSQAKSITPFPSSPVSREKTLHSEASKSRVAPRASPLNSRKDSFGSGVGIRIHEMNNSFRDCFLCMAIQHRQFQLDRETNC